VYLKKPAVYIFVIFAALSLGLGAGCGRPVQEKKAAPKEGVKEGPAAPGKAKAPGREKVLFSFEGSTDYWEIPDWAAEKEDHVAKSIESSKECASAGSSSLKVNTNFPGKIWTSAVIEYAEFMDWTPYKRVSCDIYIPKEAPEGLKAKIVLTVGEDWRFTEMSTAIFLIPGRWTTVSASLLPGTDDWKMTVVDDNFRKDVRKIVLRVESNKGPIYSGPIYIDNFRVEE
jgi:hypothetical protein